MSGLRAIETRYGGARFRSLTEARWAVFFTRLGLEWEHESQGYEVTRRRRSRYLPDFFLPEMGLYFEVKPVNAFLVDPDGVKRWEEFAQAVAEDGGHDRSLPVKHPGVRAEVVMACGQPPNPDTVANCGPPAAAMPYSRGLTVLDDWNWAWCVCPGRQHFDVQLQAIGQRVACDCPRPRDGHRLMTGDDVRILNAYGAARAARFDDGEGAHGRRAVGVRADARRGYGSDWPPAARPRPATSRPVPQP